MQGKKVAVYGLMIALALALSYLESQVPAFFAVPGMKLGLTNIVVLLALYLMGPGSALTVNLLRILLVSLLFGNGMGLAYSAAGGLLSGLTMILLNKTGRFSMTAVSVAGGVMHNAGQILVAMALLQTHAIAWYLLILWFTGIAAGAVIGLLGSLLCGRLERFVRLEGGRS